MSPGNMHEECNTGTPDAKEVIKAYRALSEIDQEFVLRKVLRKVNIQGDGTPDGKA